MHFSRISALAGLILIPAYAHAQTSTTSASLTETSTATAPNLEVKQAEPVVTEKPKAEEKKPAGFTVSPIEGFTLNFKANIHADARFYFEDDDAHRVSDTFILRRVRPSLEGKLWNFASFRIMPDFGNGRVELLDAYADLEAHSALRFRIGKGKGNFGLERLQSQTDLIFIERSQVTGFPPNRDLGAMIHGEVLNKALHYSVGVWNGVPDGASGDLDTEDNKDYIGRVFVKPFRLSGIKFLHEVGFGIAGSHGIRRGRASAPGLPTYRTPGQQVAFQYDGDGTAPNTTFANGALDKYSPQAAIYLGPFGLMAEYVHTRQEVNKAGQQAALTHDAYQFTGSFLLTGESARYTSIEIQDPASLANGTWGALELAVRYDHASFSRDAINRGLASGSRSYTKVDGYWFGVNWYLNNNVKLVANFMYSKLEGDESLPDNEKALFTRVQLSF